MLALDPLALGEDPLTQLRQVDVDPGAVGGVEADRPDVAGVGVLAEQLAAVGERLELDLALGEPRPQPAA